ncbi:F-box only protein 27-like [Vicugna pacos]|uniref:F-box only protein 27-like n=1 Tax=Vicugna pacos TaxID=30538 RepID=A0ABM5DNM6_VICPA
MKFGKGSSLLKVTQLNSVHGKVRPRGSLRPRRGSAAGVCGEHSGKELRWVAGKDQLRDCGLEERIRGGEDTEVADSVWELTVLGDSLPWRGDHGCFTLQGQADRGSPVVSEPKEALGLSQLPPELLLAVLSLLPPRTLLGRCRQVCRRWRALVDAPGLWLKILARDHRALWPVVRSCLPRADAASACLLGRFCARGPIGRNLLCKREREDGFQKWMRLSDGDDWPEEENCQVIPGLPYLTYLLSAYRCCYNKKVLDLEEEGFWPELLDSGKMEIYVSHRWTDQQGTNCVYQLIAQILDANHVILDHFSPKPYPIRQCRNNVIFEVSHVFSNLKTGVRFVSLEHWIWDMELYSEHCGIYLPDSSVIVQVRPS